MNRRDFIAAAALFPSILRAQPSRDWVSAADAGAVGDGTTDDTRALQAALAAHRGLFLPAGKTYLSDPLTLRAGNFVFGAGESSILKQRSAPNGMGLLYANSGAADRVIEGLAVSNLQLRGQVDTLGFSEWQHLIALHGVRGVTVDKVVLRGFRGDGIYLGSGTSGGEERHNYDVKVTGCTIDGVNRDNRNGLSAIDVDGLLVTGCRFTRCTRKKMPGPIDLEPDAQPWHVIRNVTIRGNHFEDNGGGVGEVSMVVPGVMRSSPANIVIEDNDSVGYRGNGSFFALVANQAHNTASDVRLRGNRDGATGRDLQVRRIVQPSR